MAAVSPLRSLSFLVRFPSVNSSSFLWFIFYKAITARECWICFLSVHWYTPLATDSFFKISSTWNIAWNSSHAFFPSQSQCAGCEFHPNFCSTVYTFTSKHFWPIQENNTFPPYAVTVLFSSLLLLEIYICVFFHLLHPVRIFSPNSLFLSRYSIMPVLCIQSILLSFSVSVLWLLQTWVFHTCVTAIANCHGFFFFCFVLKWSYH